jgi:acyl-CoA synthetase (AMP-forming)/AMP-acid ligase II
MAYVPEIVTLADLSRYHARVRPDATAAIHANRMTSYAELDRRSSRVANGLLAMGMTSGARIALLDQNSDRYFEVLLGVAKIGAVSVTVNWRLAASEIAYLLKDSHAQILFIGSRHVGLARTFIADLEHLRQIIVFDDQVDSWPAYVDWISIFSDVDPGYMGCASDTAMQIYTSGTTGLPKGVELSHASFFALNRYRALDVDHSDPHFAWIDWEPSDVVLIALPGFHIGGTYWALLGLYAGAQLIILRQFDPGEVLSAIARRRVSMLALVPTMIQQVLLHPDCSKTDFSSLEYLIYGASPIPFELLRQATATFKCRFIQVYGMTELCGVVAYLPAEDHHSDGTERMRSAGKAIAGVKLDIRDAQGSSLPQRCVGEIWVHSETRMRGYWNLPEATTVTMTEDGWVRTGDAGFIDGDGYVYVQDRIKDMIVSGGENIYPAEVESAIYGHPSVEEVAVIAVPDPMWGEAVKAVVVLRRGCEPDAESILAYTRQRLGSYKIPRSIDFVSVLPKNATGKVLKRELRKPYWEAHARQVN